MKKNLLVAGATGFVGRNALEHFAKMGEYNVFAVHNKRPKFDVKNVTWIQGDLTKSEDVDRCLKGMNVVVQAAATTSGAKDIVSRPFIHVTDNAVMNSLLFRSAYEQSVEHVVFFSCTVMYQSGDRPQKETDFNANDELHQNYFGVGWTKISLEKQAEFYSRLKRTKYTVFRHSNVYGPHDKYDLERSHVFGATVTKVMTNTDGIMDVWGNGETGRDLIYVDDLNNAIELALKNQKTAFELLNIGLGKAVSVNDLVGMMIKESGKKIDIRHDLTKPSINTKLCLDCTKAEEAIGWKVKTDLPEGIKKTLAWYRENILK